MYPRISCLPKCADLIKKIKINRTREVLLAHLAPTNFSFSLLNVTKAGVTFVQIMLRWWRAQTSVTVVLLDVWLQLVCVLTSINASCSRLLPTQVLSEQLSPVASSHRRSASPWPGRRPSSSTLDPFCSRARPGWTPAELKHTQTERNKNQNHRRGRESGARWPREQDRKQAEQIRSQEEWVTCLSLDFPAYFYLPPNCFNLNIILGRLHNRWTSHCTVCWWGTEKFPAAMKSESKVTLSRHSYKQYWCKEMTSFCPMRVCGEANAPFPRISHSLH